MLMIDASYQLKWLSLQCMSECNGDVCTHAHAWKWMHVRFKVSVTQFRYIEVGKDFTCSSRVFESDRYCKLMYSVPLQSKEDSEYKLVFEKGALNYGWEIVTINVLGLFKMYTITVCSHFMTMYIIICIFNLDSIDNLHFYSVIFYMITNKCC